MNLINYSKEIRGIKNCLISWRRDIHKFPETGWVEYRTSATIADVLFNLGLDVKIGEEVCQPEIRMGVPPENILCEHESRALKEGANPYWLERMKGGKTGVVGILHTKKPGPIIALRFDIDANDLHESRDMEHKPVKEDFYSRHRGVMHACGHDGHVAIGLGAARVLANHKDKLCGEIRLIFQPAEEGCRGAKSIVSAGWLDNVDYLFSAHIGLKCIELGEIALSTHGYLATSKIDVKYYGKAAHAGLNPEEGKNALLGAAAATLGISNIKVNTNAITRVNVGMLKAGTARNIIPNLALMRLETRADNDATNDNLKTKVLNIIEANAKIYDIDYSYQLVGKAPCLTDISVMPNYLEKEIMKNPNNKKIIKSLNVGGSEDVVYMIKRVQEQNGKAYNMLLGSDLSSNHHQSMFDFNEDVLGIGVENFCRLVFACMKGDVDN